MPTAIQRPAILAFMLALTLTLSGCAGQGTAGGAAMSDAANGTKNADPDGWTSLFDGKTLKNWKVTDFGGGGQPRVESGNLILPVGETLTGVTWTGPALPTMNYEVYGEAKRVDGSDFFYGLTFPVRDSHASLIIGGWGGGVCGISSLDGFDASENETTTFRGFETGKWYKFRLRVTPKKIEAWIDNDKIVDASIEGRKIGVRIEVEQSKPFGLASYQTTAAIRNLKVRKIEPPVEAKKK
jgi:3-keto-disaccharide hydrolase